jgi:hypothetical protein
VRTAGNVGGDSVLLCYQRFKAFGSVSQYLSPQRVDFVNLKDEVPIPCGLEQGKNKLNKSEVLQPQLEKVVVRVRMSCLDTGGRQRALISRRRKSMRPGLFAVFLP